MSHALRHPARVDEEGKLVFLDPPGWRRAVAHHRGRMVWVSVVRQQHARTMSQSRYYWGVVVRDIADFCGEGREDTHEYLKGLHLPKRNVELLDGQRLEMPPSTTTLTVEQMTEYIETCRRWSAQFLGLSIPSPGEVEEAL